MPRRLRPFTLMLCHCQLPGILHLVPGRDFLLPIGLIKTVTRPGAFGKTPGTEGFPESEFAPAEFISLPLSLPDSPVCNLALPILIQTSLSLFASSRVQTCRCHRPQPESPDRARANLKCLPPLPISADVTESFKSQKKDDAERHRLNGFW